MSRNFVAGRVAVIAIVATLATATAAQAQKLVAEPYPGSVADPNARRVTAPRVVYYSMDPPEKVLAFYKIPADRAKELESGVVVTLMRADESGEIFSLKAPVGAGGTYGMEVGITIQAVAPEARCGSGNAILASLEGYVAVWGRDPADVKKACAKYGHLDVAVYPADENGKDRGAVIEDEFDRDMDQKLEQDGASQEDVAKQLQEAAMKGDMKEFQRLTKVLRGEGDRVNVSGKDRWDEAMPYLERMDAIDYRTRISIDRHPSNWTDADFASK
jgi:hypothetical protein